MDEITLTEKDEKITSCSSSQFLANMNEISSYIFAKKQNQLLNNIPRLINLIRIFFESILYYKKNSPSKFIVLIDEKAFQVKFEGYDPKGKPVDTDLDDVSEYIVKNVISDLVNSMNNDIFKSLSKTLNEVLSSASVDIKHKISILNAENDVLERKWSLLTRTLPEKLAVETIKVRKSFIFKVLKEPRIIDGDVQYIDENIIALHSAYELYIKVLIQVHIHNNHFSDIYNIIYQELDEILKNSCHTNINSQKIIAFLLHQLVLNNNLFSMEKKDNLRGIVSEYKDKIEVKDFISINEFMNINLQDFSLGSLSVGMKEPDFSNVNLEEIITRISFVIPYHLGKSFEVVKLPDSTEIEFQEVSNLFSDPAFSFLDSMESHINGMPLTFVSDSIGKVNNSSIVTISSKEFYHPDFEFLDGQVIEKTFEKEDALRGSKYYPHKDLVLEKLWMLYEMGSFPFEIEYKDIQANLISNYLVSYFENQKLVHHKLFLLTNNDSYIKSKDLFSSRLNQLYLDDDMCELKDFIQETSIYSKDSFLQFCCQLIKLSVKKSIEFGGGHKAFWTERKGNKVPVHEATAQSIIYSQIRYLAEIKGIRMSRESFAADGSVDFHFSYNKNDRIYNVCVELKNAHHGDILHGLNSQLPLYIRDVGSKEGIFLVLWYKSDSFVLPKHFDSTSQMQFFLNENIPTGYNIKPIIIDCTTKISPSKKSSGDRLL